MKDVALGILATIACFFVLVVGFGMGKSSAVDDCKAFGAFKEAGVVYDCKPRAGSN